MIRFLLDGEVVEVEAAATDTLLDLLRYRLRRTGTKEGCAEGDCGACTVLVGGRDGGDGVVWRAVNSCIMLLPMIDGKALMTVESVGRPGVGGVGALHPVQRELVERHGSQCGFCTPGFVMSLVGRQMAALGTEGTPVADVIAGNLCRCTGYGPILAVGEAVPAAPRDDRVIAAQLAALDPAGEGRDWFAPRTADALAALLVRHPDARIVAGATDIGLWVTKQHRALGTTIFIGDVADLRGLDETPAGLTIGAAVRYSEAQPALARLHPALGELLRRIGGVQVRNAGTIGGNIANGSPIGDMPPALIALGATLTLRKGAARRTIELEDFFKSYGVQDRAPGEFVESVFVPRPDPSAIVEIGKLSKRFDSDISGVCGAFVLHVSNDGVTDARIAFGGMAPIPARARGCEAALIGAPWTGATIDAAVAALADDYRPLDDLRGSAAYRLRVAGGLLRRLYATHRGEVTSVLSPAVAHG